MPASIPVLAEPQSRRPATTGQRLSLARRDRLASGGAPPRLDDCEDDTNRRTASHTVISIQAAEDGPRRGPPAGRRLRVGAPSTLPHPPPPMGPPP